MEKRLQDSELRVMNVLWREGEATAKHVAEVLGAEIGWNVNTTYTLIKRCIEKGAIARSEPNFLCRPLVQKEEVQRAEADALLGKLFDGSADKLFAALLNGRRLSKDEIDRLRSMIDELE